MAPDMTARANCSGISIQRDLVWNVYQYRFIQTALRDIGICLYLHDIYAHDGNHNLEREYVRLPLTVVDRLT